jgi:hypothetical protein
MSRGLNHSINNHPHKPFQKNRRVAMLYSYMIVSKGSGRLQVPNATQQPIAMVNRDTLQSPELMLPHAGMSSRRDRMQALALNVSSKARLLTVFKLSQSTTNAASNALIHNTIHTPSTNTTSSTVPSEDGASEHGFEQSLSTHLIGRTPQNRHCVNRATLKAPQH